MNYPAPTLKHAPNLTPYQPIGTYWSIMYRYAVPGAAADMLISTRWDCGRDGVTVTVTVSAAPHHRPTSFDTYRRTIPTRHNHLMPGGSYAMAAMVQAHQEATADPEALAMHADAIRQQYPTHADRCA